MKMEAVRLSRSWGKAAASFFVRVAVKAVEAWPLFI